MRIDFSELSKRRPYEASGDVNNAFIAYRNAYHTYQEEYRTHFGLGVPHQLKIDLLRTAHLNGFYEELVRFKEIFGMDYDQPAAELVFFWQNGLGPVKGEWRLIFTS